MTPEILEWGAGVIDKYDLSDRSCIEVGSYDVNGSLKQFFEGAYLGIDQTEGPGVNLVANVRELSSEVCADVIVCTEVIEHDPRPWEVVKILACLLNPGGHLILTAPSIQFHRHDYPGDFYRYTQTGLMALVEWAGLEVLEARELPGEVFWEGVLTRVGFATSVLVARKP